MAVEDRSTPQALLFDVQGTATDCHTTVCSEARRISAGRHTQVEWAGFVERWRAGYFAALESAAPDRDNWTTVHSVYRDLLADGTRARTVDLIPVASTKLSG